MYSAIAANKRNTVLVMLLFLLIIGGLGALAGWLYQSWGITIAVLVGAALYALIQYWAASKELLALTGARQVTEQSQMPRLWRLTENLTIANGMPMPKLYIINDPSPNAFATGTKPENAIVGVTTGLLEIMDDTKLEGVLAHELGHIQNYDIRLNMVVFGLVVAIGLIADVLFRLAFYGGRSRGNNNNGAAQIIRIVVGLVAAIVAPLVAALVQAAVSRQREYLADATGATTTRYPEGLARALEKIGQASEVRESTHQNTAMAHMWFASPLAGKALTRMFSTHPPIPERVARLRNMGGRF